ncbi:hypothetical protein PRIPAC_86364 [Pristionchus pacificus]|nr:hypothetical protein PRIPAC_86364 [Pristionchus pacificus]
MDDGRPPCERIIISHFDEKDKAHHLLAGKIDVERAALVCACLGMIITVCVFIVSLLLYHHFMNWRQLLVMLLLFVLFSFAHHGIKVAVKEINPSYLLPFIVVYLLMILAESYAVVATSYHYYILKGALPIHVSHVDAQAQEL